MAGEQIEATVTEAEVIAFGHKLAEWAATITTTERAILGELVTRAVYTADHDVEGYDSWIRRGHTDADLSFLQPRVIAFSPAFQSAVGAVFKP